MWLYAGANIHLWNDTEGPNKDSWIITSAGVALAPCIAHAYNPDKYAQCDWFSSPSQCSEDRMYIETYDSNAARIDKYNSLIPKLVWRGSDWRYLSEYESVGTGSGFEFLHQLGLCHASRSTIIDAVLHSSPASTVEKRVPPRLYAAVLGSLNPESFDIKFTDRNEHAPQSSCIDDKFNLFTSDEMDACDYSNYKYLADFGGGGGTSWKSTLWFLGMPGVLFHHETPMRDSFYDDIQPWVHYIPLDEDLFKLRRTGELGQGKSGRMRVYFQTRDAVCEENDEHGWLNRTPRRRRSWNRLGNISTRTKYLPPTRRFLRQT